MSNDVQVKISKKVLEQGARAIRGLSSGERAFADSEKYDGDNTLPVQNIMRNDMPYNVALQSAVAAAVGSSASEKEQEQAISAMLDYGRAHPSVR